MARIGIAWTSEAKDDLRQILTFYNKRNGNHEYSKRLHRAIRNYEALIAEFPKIGFETDFPNVRCGVLGNFQIIYEFDSELAWIVMIWDSRRDPEQKNIARRLKSKGV